MFNKQCNRHAVVVAMLASLVLGLIAYFQVNSYAAPIVSAFVGMLIIVIWTKVAPDTKFKWSDLHKNLSSQV